MQLFLFEMVYFHRVLLIKRYYKKRFVVTADNRFLVSVSASDTICVIQKIKHLSLHKNPESETLI
jgi:hypothetical protein